MYTSKLAFALPVFLLAVGCSTGTPSAEHASAQDPGQVCAGLPSEAREVSLFDWQGVAFVEARNEHELVGKAPRQRAAGARVFVPASEGLTKEYVHRAASCQAAQHAASGQQSRDPLAVPGVEVRVSAAQNGYLVDLIADDAARGREVLQRVRSATSRSEVEQLAMSVDEPSLF